MTATKNPVVSKKAKKKTVNSVKKSGKIQRRQKQDIKKPQGIEKKLKSIEIAPHTLNSSKVTQGVSELLRLNEEFKKSKSELFDTEGQPVFMCVSACRIANTPKRILRFSLPHSLVQETSDIALIVRDLEPRKRRPDNDAVVQLYESRLHTHGVKHPIKVMPIRQVMTEFNTYEAKRQLSNQFDIFLADAHISSRLVPILGKVFTQKRVNPIPVKIDDGAEMKKSIEKALAKTSMKISSDGGTMTVQMGHTLQTAKDISENIICVAEELTKSFPGGWLNIRNIVLKTATSPGIPLYVAIRNPGDILLLPQKLKLKHGQPVEGELSTQMDKVVRVTPSGKIIVKEAESSDKSKKNKARKAKRKLKKRQQQQLKDDDEDLEDLEEDEVSEMEEETPEVEEEKPATYESDSEDPEADEAEEAYLSELHSTTSHLQKNKKAKKQGADESKDTKSPKKKADKKAKKTKEETKEAIKETKKADKKVKKTKK